MKKFNKTLLTTLSTVVLFTTVSQVDAQVTVIPDDEKFSLKLIGRTNVDAGTYFEEHGATEHADNGVSVNDTRLGVAGTFLDNWDYKVEICFDQKAISFRDVLFKYNFNKQHHIQFGNYFLPFGLKPLGLNYKFIDNATVDAAICPGRKIGIEYLFTTDHFNFTGGIFSDGNIDNGNKQFDQGLNIVAKAIYRPIIDENTVLHIGVAPIYSNSPNAGSFSGIVPETFTSESRSTTVKDKFDAPSYSRYELEFIFIEKRFLLEVHYQGASAEPRTLDSRYHIGGLLAQTSFLLIGEQQNYNKATGLTKNASARNLELLARYDYLDLHEGGRQSDFTVGLNYFFSKHFNLKFNYVYTDTFGTPANDSYNSVQVRAQFSF